MLCQWNVTTCSRWGLRGTANALQVDLTDETALGRLEAMIREINAGVKIVRTEHCQVDLAEILNQHAYGADRWTIFVRSRMVYVA